MINRIRSFIYGQTQDKDFSEVLRGGSIAFGYRLCSMILGYVLLVVITREYGKEGLGLYNLALAVLTVLLMATSLGFNSSIKRFAAQYNNKLEGYKLSMIYEKVMQLIFPLSLLLSFALFFTAPAISNFVYHDEAISIPLKIVAIVLPIFTIMMFNVEFINGLKLVHVSELFRNLNQQALTLIAIVIFLGSGLFNFYPIIFYSASICIAFLVTSAYLFRILKARKKSFGEIREKINFRSHLLISLPMIFSSFIQILNGRIDTLMIGIYEDTGTIGIYSAAFKITFIINFVLASLKTIATPKISELFWSKKIEQLKNIIYKTSVLIFVFSLPICFLIILFAEPILNFVSPEFVEGKNALIILAIAQLINSFCGLVAAFLNMTGDQVYFTKIIAISTVLNIILNVLLIPHYGMTGAAIATLISISLWNILGSIRIYKRHRIYSFFYPRFD